MRSPIDVGQEKHAISKPRGKRQVRFALLIVIIDELLIRALNSA